MGVYRVEASPNNRAGCINKECKTAGVKILKGELRYAIQVTINEHQSWQYKHFGCVTPKQIDNLIETSGGDTEMVDGFDELSEEYQEKIKFALENGHVPDEDWKGDIEANRDGHAGMRLTKAAQKKKAKEAGRDLDDEEEKPKKKRGKTVKAEDDEEDDKPAPKTKRSKGVKKEVDAEDVPAPKKRSRPVKKEADEEDEVPAPKKARAARGKKVEYKEEDEDDDEAPRKRKSKSRAKKVTVNSEDEADLAEESEDHDIADEEDAPKPKRGKTVTANSGAKVLQKRGRKKAATSS